MFDAEALADRQLALDTKRTKRFPELLSRKMERMSASPLAYLRGAAPLFYEVLAQNPELAEGPPGEGWICGDLHLENFGAYRPDSLDEDDSKSKKRPVVFELNDFDDTFVGPWRLDLLRLTTSLLLGGRELGANGILALDLADHLLDAWSEAAFDGAPRPEPPAPVVALIEQVRARSRVALLDARTELDGDRRRFTRGPRYADLAGDVRSAVPAVFAAYLGTVPEAERPDAAKCSLEIVDAALRIAGTGSLGGLRIAVLIEGKGGPNGAWIFDMKEQGDPSATALVGKAEHEPAERVVTGFRACVEHPPRVLGTTRFGKISMLGRRLSPQEDKLNYKKLPGAELPALARYLGAILGQAHARGATKAPRARWSKSDRELVRRRAIQLAGLHEAIYLALCERIRRM